MDSNMIKGVKTLKVILYIFAALFLVSGCDQEEKTENLKDNPALLWIQEAVAIAEKIPSDLHEVEHDRCLSRTAVTALEVGVFDQTDTILKSINSWRKADLYARLARTCYLDNKIKEGDELIGKARCFLKEHQFEEWQVSRVHAGIEEAGHLKGEQTDAALLRQLERSDQAKLLPSMVEGNLTTTNLVEMLTRLEASTNTVMDIDMASTTIDAYRLMYEKSQKKEELKDLRNRVLAGMKKTLRNVHTSIACYKLLDFSKAAISAGDVEFMDEIHKMLDERLGMIRIDMRVPVILSYAEFLIQQGKLEQALEKLRYVEDNINDPAILFTDRPVFLARCGFVYGKTGNKVKMSELLSESLKVLNTFKNARPRAMTATDVCHICARGGVDSPELLESMKMLESNLSDPW